MRRLRGSFSRPGNLNADNFGQHALRLIGNVFFGLFVVGVVVFTIIAATYQPEDPLLHPSDKISSFLTSTSNATFRTEESTIRTGEDFIAPTNETVAADSFINVADIPLPMNSTEITTESIPAEEDETSSTTTPTVHCDVNEPIDCSDPDIFHLMMRATIEQFKDVHFYRFGKSVQGDSTSSCDMAWRFRPKDAKRAALYKDYRRFLINRGDNCVPTVSSIGDYHSGLNARKKKSKKKKLKSPEEEDIGFEKRKRKKDKPEEVTEVPVVGETVDDALPVVESENSFSSGKYLIYMGGGDRCKDMDHFLWSFLCSLGEAQYLNRTLVMDLNICLSSTYSSSNQDEEGKDFRFYFDFEHLSESASVLDQQQFWSDWNQWQKKDNLGLYLVEDFRVTPMQLTGIKDSLIMRKFGTVEPDNYWYRVCEGETESVVQRPWHFVWKSRRLMEIVSAIATRMNWDFDSVHVVRGKKAKNKELWPNLEADTSPDSLLTTLKDKVDEGRKLYVATNERDTSLFDPLKDKYETHFLDEFKDLWAEGSEWAQEMTQLNNGVPVEFDGYMRMEVDTEVFFRGKKQLETFNDLTRDCKDGVNTCNTAA